MQSGRDHGPPPVPHTLENIRREASGLDLADRDMGRSPCAARTRWPQRPSTEAALKAPPDGYTLLQVTSTNAVNVTFYDNLNFNFASDIAPVAGIIRVPFVMESRFSTFDPARCAHWR